MSGKLTQYSVTVTGTKKQAEQELSKPLREKDTGLFVEPGKVTVGEYLDRWIIGV